MPTSQNRCKNKTSQIWKGVLVKEFLVKYNAGAYWDNYLAVKSSEECNVLGTASTKADLGDAGPQLWLEELKGKECVSRCALVGLRRRQNTDLSWKWH